MQRRIKKNIFILLAFGFSLFASFLLGELVFRVSGLRANIVPTIMDEHVGIINQPGYSGIYDREGFSNFSINSEGWRDVERSVEKPENTFRVAVVGASYIEAFQVESEAMLTTHLEQLLNQGRSGVKVEVIPFGMSGFDAAQCFLAIQHKVAKYNPDLILYAFSSGTDLRDGLRELFNAPYKPYYLLKDGGVVLDDSYKAYVKDREESLFRKFFVFLRGNSQLFAYLFYEVFPRIKTMIASSSQPEPPTPDKKPVKVKAEAGLSGLEIYREPPKDDLMDRAWKLTERLVLEMNRFCQSRNIQFMFFGVTNHAQVFQTKNSDLPEGFDFFYPEKRMIRFSDKFHIPFIPLAMKLSRLNEEQNIIFHGKPGRLGGHWNPTGHRIAAEILAETIRSHIHLN